MGFLRAAKSFLSNSEMEAWQIISHITTRRGSSLLHSHQRSVPERFMFLYAQVPMEEAPSLEVNATDAECRRIDSSLLRYFWNHRRLVIGIGRCFWTLLLLGGDFVRLVLSPNI